MLFLCTGNSARSQAAEALARARSAGRVQAFSAGSDPRPLHPNAVRVMASRGIDLAGRQPKHVTHVHRAAARLCDHPVRPGPGGLPGVPWPSRFLHWSIADPAASVGSDEDTYPAFEQMAAELETRIGFWLATVTPAPAHASV